LQVVSIVLYVIASSIVTIKGCIKYCVKVRWTKPQSNHDAWTTTH